MARDSGEGILRTTEHLVGRDKERERGGGGGEACLLMPRVREGDQQKTKTRDVRPKSELTRTEIVRILNAWSHMTPRMAEEIQALVSERPGQAGQDSEQQREGEANRRLPPKRMGKQKITTLAESAAATVMRLAKNSATKNALRAASTRKGGGEGLEANRFSVDKSFVIPLPLPSPAPCQLRSITKKKKTSPRSLAPSPCESDTVGPRLQRPSKPPASVITTIHNDGQERMP